MKTPRQLLLERHRAIEPKLDEIRGQVIPKLVSSDGRTGSQSDAIVVPSWRVIFLSLRCHIAGMSAIWLMIIFLNFDFSESNGNASSQPIAQKAAPSPQQVVTALLENRRQVAELTSSPVNDTPAISIPQSFVPPRRSELIFPTGMA